MTATSPNVECGNCFEGKSDLHHVCRACKGTGRVLLATAVQTIHVDQLTNEQARQWLIDNDRDGAEFWRTIESNDLPRAVCDSLRDYDGGQNGSLHVVLTDDACRRLLARSRQTEKPAGAGE